jgi:outer membrane protein TolC
MRTLITTLLLVAAGSGLFAAEEREQFDPVDPVLAGLIEEVLENHPDVLSARAGVRALREGIPQARSLPDPRISVRTFLEGPETRVGPQQYSLEVSQAVPWGGKRGLRADRATSLMESREWGVRDLQRTLVAELKRAWFEIAYLGEAIAVNREEKELLERFEGIALKRYAAGEGIQQNVIKVQTDISRLEDREATLIERKGVLLRRIAELTGHPDRDLALEPVRLEIPHVELDRHAMEEGAIGSHPSVRAVRERIEADRVRVRRKRLEARPDFRFGVGYTAVGGRDDAPGLLNPPPGNGDDIASVTVGINLPVFKKRIRAGVAEAEESVRSGEQSLRAVENRLRTGIRESLLRLDSLGDRAGLHGEVIIPQARQALASAESAYSAGRHGFLDLLDAQRVLFQARLTYHRLVADSWIVLAELERVSGRPVPGSEARDEER